MDCGEVVHGKLGSNVDFDEASVVGFFGGVVAVGGSDWFDGLCLCVCVCGSVYGLMVCVCMCVCVVMGLDRWIGVSWVCVCV